MADCGLFDSEVFADADGTYLGDFAYGDGPGGPFGWVGCMSFCENPTFFFGIFDYFAPPTPCDCRKRVAIGVPDATGAGPTHTEDDTTGPTGLEAEKAMVVNLPGSPDCFVGWAGPQVVDPVTGDWVYGLLDGDIGWKPADDETWVFQCWAKIVPDQNGVEVAGAKLEFAVAPNGFGWAQPTADSLDLDTTWQFFQTVFTGGFIPTSTFYWPLIRFAGAIENQVDYTAYFFGSPIPDRGWAPYGRVHVKCAHLYKLHGGAGNWIDSFHGHG